MKTGHAGVLVSPTKCSLEDLKACYEKKSVLARLDTVAAPNTPLLPFCNTVTDSPSLVQVVGGKNKLYDYNYDEQERCIRKAIIRNNSRFIKRSLKKGSGTEAGSARDNKTLWM